MRFDFAHSEIFLRDDGIIQMNSRNHTYTVQDLKEINVAQGKISDGKRLPLLVVADQYSDIESDAREFMASFEATQFSSAEAYVLRSLGHKILGNFYLKVNKPGVPTRFFNEKTEALQWLLTYLPSAL